MLIQLSETLLKTISLVARQGPCAELPTPAPRAPGWEETVPEPAVYVSTTTMFLVVISLNEFCDAVHIGKNKEKAYHGAACARGGRRLVTNDRAKTRHQGTRAQGAQGTSRSSPV